MSISPMETSSARWPFESNDRSHIEGNSPIMYIWSYDVIDQSGSR